MACVHVTTGPGGTTSMGALDSERATQEMVGAIDAVCDVAQRIIGKLKDGTAAGGSPLLGVAVGNGAGGYPPTQAMKRFATASPGRRESSLHPVTKRRYRSAVRFSRNTHPRKPKVKQLGSLNPNRLARRSCCTLQRSRRVKALSFLTRPRPTRLRCRPGLTRTEAPSAERAVARLPTSRLVQQRLNRRRRQRKLGTAKLAPMPVSRLLPRQIR